MDMPVMSGVVVFCSSKELATEPVPDEEIKLKRIGRKDGSYTVVKDGKKIYEASLPKPWLKPTVSPS